MSPRLPSQQRLPAEPDGRRILRRARPFLKWAGGKQQLLAQFEQYLPTNFKRYFELFVGGGAVFFHLWDTGRLPTHHQLPVGSCQLAATIRNPQSTIRNRHEVFLFDNSEELINAYKVVRDNLEELVSLLAAHREKHSREYYYAIRDLDRHSDQLAVGSWQLADSGVERAARTIYLNKTCYNGLYRVNAKGQFNVPMGSYKNPKILHEDVLRAASAALQGVTIEARDFRSVVDLCRPGDFVYLDPPYHPLSSTASFRSYTAASFGDDDQRDLADVFRQLTEKGCLCMLSNSYTPFIMGLYRDFRIETVNAIRAINCNGQGRASVREVLVLCY